MPEACDQNGRPWPAEPIQSSSRPKDELSGFIAPSE